jgi:hypothetical protein
MKKLWNKFVQACYKWAKASGIVCVMMMVGCNEQVTVTQSGIREGHTDSVSVKEVTIQGCQYIYWDWANGTWGSHKGNCNNPIHAIHDTVYIPAPESQK